MDIREVSEQKQKRTQPVNLFDKYAKDMGTRRMAQREAARWKMGKKNRECTQGIGDEEQRRENRRQAVLARKSERRQRRSDSPLVRGHHESYLSKNATIRCCHCALALHCTA